MYVRMLGYMFKPLYVHVAHTQHTHTHTVIHTHKYKPTPHCNMFVHTALIQTNLSQRYAETSELLRRINSSKLDPQPCVVLICLVLVCSSVYVCMYVSLCSFELFSLALLAGGRFF